MIGQRMGKYEIVAELGSGGMGAVFRAFDPDAEREVAIKVLPRQLTAEADFLARFRHEGRIIAGLQHPHILPLHEVGEQNDVPYLVMAYVTGGSLNERMRAGQISPEFLSRLIEQVAGALDEAHRQGIVHRDIKPANILLDHNDNAYLADFGIAKMLAGSVHLSMTGATMGTPPYMSPEQWRGNALDGRSDIYSLACMVFRIVTGQLPCDAETPAGFMTQHLTSPLPSARAVNKDVSQALDSLLARSMAKEREDRPATASEFAGALTEALKAGGQQATSMEANAEPELTPFGATTINPSYPLPSTILTLLERRAFAPIFVGLLVLVGVVVGGLSLAGIFGERVTPANEAPAPAEGQAAQTTEVAQQAGASEELSSDVAGLTTEQPTATTAPTATVARLGFPGIPVTSNNQWTPVIQDFDDVEMVLVPAGCFMMGSDDGDSDEKFVHQQCFGEPFYIDVYEVTNAQYDLEGRFSGQELPRETVNWFDAVAHCESREARLPSEAEWEYAARGPDGLVYPWGNVFEADYTVYTGNSGGQTAPVGSRPGGVSWVGAYDLSGNVWEWVSSIYEEYRYNAADGREASASSDSSSVRVLRGGSWSSDTYIVRAAYSGGSFPVNSDFDIGFRCARSY